MEIRRSLRYPYTVFLISIIGLVFVSFLSNPKKALNYSAHTTHPALTNEMVTLFNHYYPQLAFSESERDLINEGSSEEDNPVIRVVNHFYDPIHNSGLAEFGGVNAKLWAQNTRMQAGLGNLAGVGITQDLFSAASDYSWERGIYDFIYGDKDRSLRNLGHILHLIEDMSVPDHTRDDAHPPAFDWGSPYEAWTSRFTPGTITTANDLIKRGLKPKQFSSLGDYFDSMASYSNNNFFSKDTILSKKYLLPMI